MRVHLVDCDLVSVESRESLRWNGADKVIVDNVDDADKQQATLLSLL